jgi:hypothetical protein
VDWYFKFIEFIARKLSSNNIYGFSIESQTRRTAQLPIENRMDRPLKTSGPSLLSSASFTHLYGKII